MQMAKNKVLVVDDNLDIRLFVKAALEAEGIEVILAENGTKALEIFRSNDLAAIILDLSMGQPDGFEVCREIRKSSSVPIIMLTSHVEEMDEAMCLAAGADDYITKPVSARILVLRTTTQLRHRARQTKEVSTVMNAGPLSLDSSSRELQVDGIKVPLTRIEYDFIHLLIKNPNRVYTREQISVAIGTSIDFSSDHLLDTHASRIRMKIKEVNPTKVLHAVRGVGYRLLSE
jgi:DNA-binding response OmpR family regulator